MSDSAMHAPDSGIRSAEVSEVSETVRSDTDPSHVSSTSAAHAAVSRGEDATLDFALSVARGLCDHPRRLDSRLLYDADGSAIFERICEQPEYYLTRTEASILESAAEDIARRTGDVTLVEFGSGSSIKTQLLLDAYAAQYGDDQLHYAPVDVSHSILHQARTRLASRFPSARLSPVHATYDQAFPMLASLSPCMLLFLGSSVGNLDHTESLSFWSRVGSSLGSGDYCLLGIDINKDSESLHAAYNDAAGHSAAFTRNVFERMNRELGSMIDTDAIEHVARYVPHRHRVEIFARLLSRQRIEIEPLSCGFTIDAGELVQTEVSRKFELDRITPYLQTFGLAIERVYSDVAKRFAVLLLRRA